MAMQRRLKVQFGDVFPVGAFLVGEVEPVLDFDAPKRADGVRPQAMDKESGLPVWSVPVLDADPEAGKKEKTAVVKFSARVRPVPPRNDTPFPFTPVEFTGLTATAYVDDNGQYPRLAWSLRADGMCAPGQAGKGSAEPVKAA
jgi:hypothetical protein